MENTFPKFSSPKFSSPKFSSPVTSQKRWTSNKNKRKCTFGSLEKRDRKQFHRSKGQENRMPQAKFNNSCGQDDGFSPLSWADEVENHEKVVFTEKARSKYGGNTRKQLDMDNIQSTGNGEIGKKLPNAVKNALQPTMTDPHRLQQRQKQIDMGKNTLGYDMFTKYVSRSERTPNDPRTPDKYQQCSTRSWQGQIKVWRRCLHMWDPEDANQRDADPFSTSTSISFSSEGDMEGIPSAESSQTSDYTAAQMYDPFDEELFGSFDAGNESSIFEPFDL